MAAAAPPIGDVPAVHTTSDAALNAAFTAADTAAVVPATPAPEATPAPAAPIVAPETSIIPTTSAPAVAPVPESTDLDFSEGTGPDSVDEAGKRHFYTVSKSQRLQRAAKFVEALQEIVPDVTIEKLKLAVERAHAAEAMMLRYHEGAENPNAIDDIIDAFVANDNSKAFGMMVIRMVGKLAMVEPQAEGFLQQHFNSRLIEWLKSRSRSIIDPKEREEAVATIQRVQMAITGGRYEKTQDILQGLKVDPNEAMRQSLEQRERNLNEQQRRQRETTDAQWNNYLNQQEAMARTGEVDAVLAPVKARYEATPYWEPIRQEFLNAIGNAEAAHPEWYVRYENLRREAMLNRSEESVNALAGFRRSIARQIVLPNAKPILDRWANVVITNNTAAHDKAKNQPPNEPSPNGVAPSAANGINIDAALKSKTADEAFKALGWN